MSKCYINDKEVNFTISDFYNKGGEADLFYHLKKSMLAKLYKTSTHIDIKTDEEKFIAKNRLIEQQKKLPALKKKLQYVSSNIIVPQDLIYNGRKQIMGYTMPMIKNANILHLFFNSNFKKQNATNNQIIEILLNLYNVVEELHGNDIIVGDFNDLNVLVKIPDIFMIDTDSFQFDNFLCKAYTETFVDPLLCDIKGKELSFCRPYNIMSDWYAYSNMFFAACLSVLPYGGVYFSKGKSNIPSWQRPFLGISVFHPGVKYPKNALHYDVFPDEILHFFQKMFEEKKRDIIPRKIIENIRWTKCSSCGHEHARNTCPMCSYAEHAIKEKISGNIKITHLYKNKKQIVNAVCHNGQIKWVDYKDSIFTRENNLIKFNGEYNNETNVCIQGNKTIIGKKDRFIVLEENKKPLIFNCDSKMGNSIVVTNSKKFFWIDNGRLYKTDILDNPFHIGDVLKDKTRIWVGEEFGFGFYYAGKIYQPFIFSIKDSGINDNLKIENVSGQIIDINCTLSKNYAWFFLTVKEKSKLLNKCYVYNKQGNFISQAEERKGESSWLGNIHGCYASGNTLFMPTDKGIIRVDIDNGDIIESREYSDTEKFISAESKIIGAADGLVVLDASRQEIYLLQVRGSA